MITAWIGALVFLLVLVLYILLALGQPLGDFAMGGRYKVLPRQMRAAAGISALVQAFAILVILQVGGVFSIGLPGGLARGLAYFFGVYLALNTIMNALSKSKKERYVMTPLSAVAAFCFFYTAMMA